MKQIYHAQSKIDGMGVFVGEDILTLKKLVADKKDPSD
ncbi:MAG: hypothetical protein UT65_C0002G0025 [Parcubacteria group bacterium GW2011_GWF2_39_8b]|nr:MAG: hypothetical protein UT65_C0002G0025 [Parcubacteria group bacterium GW2011_GWF2_39_8b]KKR46026.1 MAG: hypothetical protein UT81_C0003G0043 [Parcubacteria group bacterium GW2011_GWA2_40_14]